MIRRKIKLIHLSMRGGMPHRSGFMAAARDRLGGVARFLVAALLLQYFAPLHSHAFPHPQADASYDTLAICSDNGVRYVHPDGTPADPPTEPRQGTGHDCCTVGCHPHNAVAPGLISLTAVTGWQPADTPFVDPLIPDSTAHLAAPPRGPPLTV